MSSINFTTHANTQNSKLQKKALKEQSFLGNAASQSDKVEISKNKQEEKEESFIAQAIKRFTGLDISEPKKALKVLGISALSVVVVMLLGNKLGKPCQKLGNIIDNVLLSDKNVLGKVRNALANFVSPKLTKAKDVLSKPKFVQDIIAASRKPKNARWNIFRGYENGAKGVFATTIRETLNGATEKDALGAQNALKNLFGEKNATDLLSQLANEKVSNVEFADNFLSLAKDLSTKNNVGLQEIFEKIGTEPSLKGIKLKNWAFSNKINSISNKLFKKNIDMLDDNLSDSLMKYSAIRGQSAKTLPAKIVQMLPILVTEQYSSFVNDKSDYGIFLVLSSVCPTIGNLLDMPKEERAKTEAHSVLSSSLSWLISSPIAFKMIYGAAALKEGSANPILKTIGKIMSIGLDNKTTRLGGVSGVLGGIGRFILIFSLGQLIGKPINKLCDKIFGKPYNKDEELRKQQEEAQMNQVIPELGVSQNELMEKIRNNPSALEKLQNDPELNKKIQENPKLLLDLLNGKDVSSTTIFKRNIQTNQSLSQANENYLKKQQSKDTATYIPLSQFKAKSTSSMVPKLQGELGRMNAKTEKLFEQAQRYV